MLTPEEFVLGHAAEEELTSLALLYSFANRAGKSLLAPHDGRLKQILLDGEDPHYVYEIGTRRDWPGIIVPDVRVWVDEEKLISPYVGSLPIGCLLRRDTGLYFIGQAPGGFGTASAQLVGGLRQAPEQASVGFSRWRLTIGHGENERTLFEHEVKSERGQTEA